MPRKRTNVEKIREILRLNQELKFSIRQIAEAAGVSKTSVGEYTENHNLKTILKSLYIKKII
jgi:hypothetical protein